jgi:hypothetical protein
MNRVEAVDKVTGRPRYAYEQHAETAAAYAYPVQSPTASGFVRTVDFGGVRAMPGVLAVLSCTDPPELGSAEDPELALFAIREISYRGQLVARVDVTFTTPVQHNNPMEPNPRARENRGRTAGGVDVKGSSKQGLMDRAQARHPRPLEDDQAGTRRGDRP